MVTVCRMLRWKGYYGRDGSGPDWLAQQHAANENQYSCLRTGQPWGPDDDLATIDGCGAGRACCEVRSIAALGTTGRKDA
jgi:hypothetical protein